MSKIVLLASGDHLENLGNILRKSLEDPDELVVIMAHMENAVEIAKSLDENEADVIIARGNTANMLRDAHIPIPIVEIPVVNTEIISAIEEAREKSGVSNPVIGYIGFKNIIKEIESFLHLLTPKIYLYEAHTSHEIESQIKDAKNKNVDILIGGALTNEMAEAAGMKYVLLESSYSSVKEAYTRAKEVQNAVNAEKKKAEEKKIILDSVSDAIISIDDKGEITMLNHLAETIFGVKTKDAAGKHIGNIFQPAEEKLITKTLSDGEKFDDKILEINGKNYAISIIPVVVMEKITGVIVTLQEAGNIQKIEASIRKGLYLKGNIAKYTFSDIKGESDEIRETINIARSFASLQSNILIIGETGTGKELFAQSIHNASSNKDAPFVAVNCGAIPSSLIESEFFGYVDGAFTGAKKGGKMGLFELAHNGTIFLDEISEMDLLGQVILLRAIQERQIRRVGGDSMIPVNVRVIAASNANLPEMVANRKFRKDLYYRLSVLVVHIPPLNERKGDISCLSKFFVDYYNTKFYKQISLSPSALAELEKFNWDGNIRQLRNFCERITAIFENSVIDGDFIRKQLNQSFYFENKAKNARTPSSESIQEYDHTQNFIINNKIIPYDQLKNLMEKYGGNRELISKELGISRTTLWKYLKQAGL